MGDLFINLLNPIFILNSIICVPTLYLYFFFENFENTINFSLNTLDFLQQRKILSDYSIDRYVYDKYNSKIKNIPFSFENFEIKAKKGKKNLDHIKLQMIKTIEEKIWIRNNFRNYNVNYLNNLNDLYFKELKYIHSDYIFNNMIYRNNFYKFNENGKINVKILFNNNSPYLFSKTNLKSIFSFELIKKQI